MPTVPDYREAMAKKGYVAVEDQKGPGSELRLPPSIQEQLLPPAPPVTDEEISLDPEVFVYSVSGFPPKPNRENGPFALVIKGGKQAQPISGGPSVWYELPMVAHFGGKDAAPSYSPLRYTTPTVAERQAALFDMMRQRGDTVAVAKKESLEAAKQDIIDCKKELFNSFEWRGGKIRRLKDVNRPQAQDATNAVGVIRSLQDAGIDVRAILAQAGIDVSALPAGTVPEEQAEQGADGVPERVGKHIPPHPPSNMG